MRQPIRDQILWPLTTLLLVAIAANAIFAAWWASRRTLESLAARQNQILAVLEESSFPLSNSVLEKLQRLTGDEFVVWDLSDQRMIVGSLTLGEADRQALSGAAKRSASEQSFKMSIGGTTYVLRTGHIRRTPTHALLVLTSDDVLKAASRSAIWPPLMAGTVTLILSIPLVMLLASGWAQRIRRLESHVKSISRGEFGLELGTGPIDDELTRLVVSINSMSRQLDAMQQELVRGERARLIAQLTAGFAHQLRNGLAGAKLAIQLHQNRCNTPHEPSLAVAGQQLTLVEEEVRGLLSLGKNDARTPADVDLTALISNVQTLVLPACEHQGVVCQFTPPIEPVVVHGFSEGLRAAVLNIVLNAIEATGAGGHVWVTLPTAGDVATIVIEDDGPGPPAGLTGSLFDSFVTSKQEGVGLGLAIATAVARDHHGDLHWCRHGARTRFEMRIPLGSRDEVIE